MSEIGRRSWLMVAVAAASVAAVMIGISVLTDTDDDGGSDPAGPITVDPAELVPATDAALAAVALQHIDEAPSNYDPLNREDGDFADDALGADLRFDGDGEYDGDLLGLIVQPWNASLSEVCRPGLDPNCDVIGTEAGEVLLSWDEAAPEEDPGVVSVTLISDKVQRQVYHAGPAITGDPRDLDLDISVDDMVAILSDPRLGLRTTPEMVEDGEELADG